MPEDSTVLPPLTPIPGCPGYSASRDGRIWSYHKTGPGFALRPVPVQLASEPRFAPNGRIKCMMVGLKINRRRVWRPVHQLILETFVGPCPDGMEGCHWDHNPANNKVDNVRWDTPHSNALDRTRRMQEEQRCIVDHKLTEDDVREILTLLERGESCAEIGRRYGVTTTNIWMIKAGRTWKWLNRQPPQQQNLFS